MDRSLAWNRWQLIVTKLVIAVGLQLFAVSLDAEAQQAMKPWRIGYLAQSSLQVGPDALGMFRTGLKELGYVEGQQYVMEVRDAEGRPEQLQKFAAELTALRVDVIVAASTPPAVAALRATRSIPIVTVAVADPVGSGLVQSLARPGGNVTGTALAFEEVSRKWLELLMMVRGRLQFSSAQEPPNSMVERPGAEPPAAHHERSAIRRRERLSFRPLLPEAAGRPG